MGIYRLEAPKVVKEVFFPKKGPFKSSKPPPTLFGSETVTRVAKRVRMVLSETLIDLTARQRRYKMTWLMLRPHSPGSMTCQI